jgi:hypothetical protein
VSYLGPIPTQPRPQSGVVFYFSNLPAGGTTLTGADSQGLTLKFIPGAITLFVNGRALLPGVDYSMDAAGTTITILNGKSFTAGDTGLILPQRQAEIAGSYSKLETDQKLAALPESARKVLSKGAAPGTATSEAVALPTGWDRWIWEFQQFAPATDNMQVTFEPSFDGGATYVSTTGGYDGYYADSVPVQLAAFGTSSNPINPASISNNLANSNWGHWMVEALVPGGGWMSFDFLFFYCISNAAVGGTAGSRRTFRIRGLFNATTNPTHLRARISSGNIARMRHRLLGEKF